MYVLQCGLFPLSQRDYPEHPFSNGNSATPTLRLENFQLAVGNLRCFDATKNSPDRKPYFNWFDPENCFISGARRAPPYTVIFWIMWFKVVPQLGDAANQILKAQTPAEIDELRMKKIKMDVMDGDEFITKEVSFISPELRAMVDNIIFMSVYGHNSLFEQRVSVGRRTAFREYALKAARDNEDEFYASWKRYRAAHPVDGTGEGADTDESESERIRKQMDGDSDGDKTGPASAADGALDDAQADAAGPA